MRFIRFFLLFPVISILCSCVNTKSVTYFNDLGDSVITRQVEDLEPAIVKNDILSITVSSLDPEAAALFNMANASGVAASSNALGQQGGYLVDKDGFIQFPMLGQVKAAGLTKKGLTNHLAQQLENKKLLKEPIITIRQTNFHVTVLGEVSHPSVIPVPNEQINIMEAIGMAGDLTIQAKKDNVLLIRQEGNNKITKRINLNSSDILTSPYYNLRSNDIVYVEPNKSKISSTSQGRQLLPIIISSISVLALVVDRIFN